MKFSGIFRLSMRTLFTRLIRFFFVVLLVCASLSLFSISLFFVQSSRYNRQACERLFQKDLQYCGILYAFEEDDIDESDSTEYMELFFEKVKVLPEVNCLGLAVDYRNDFPQKIKDIQANYMEYEGSGDSTEVTVITADMMKIIPVNFSERLQEKEIDSTKQLLVLGAAYRPAVKLGECLTVDGYEYQVIGFLDEGQKWIVSQMEVRDEIPELTNVFSSDWKVLRIDTSGTVYANSIYYSLQDDADLENFQKKVKSFAEQYHIDYDLVSMDRKLKQQEEMNKATAQSARMLFAFCILISIVMILALQISSFYMNKREYGIRYAVGMSEHDIGRMLLLENAVQFVLAVLLPIPFFLFLLPWIFTQSDAWGLLKPIFYDIFFHYTMPYTIGLAVFLTVLLSWISYSIFRRMTPVELIRSDE